MVIQAAQTQQLGVTPSQLQPSLPPVPPPQSAFDRWRCLQAFSSDATNRLDETADLAFWESVADHYDAGALPRHMPAVLERVLQLVLPGASVLDVGAGTGAFSLPLALAASYVTALDYSPAMLRVLEAKLQDNPALDVRLVLAAWENASVQEHDLVLAANALYRTRDLQLALSKLVSAARERGILVWSVGRGDEAQMALRRHVAPDRYRPGPDYVHAVDGLFELGVCARVEIVHAEEAEYFADDGAAIEGLLSWAPIQPDERSAAMQLLPGLLDRDGPGWMWARQKRVAIIWWETSSWRRHKAAR